MDYDPNVARPDAEDGTHVKRLTYPNLLFTWSHLHHTAQALWRHHCLDVRDRLPEGLSYRSELGPNI